MNQDTRNSLIILVIGIAILIFLVTYFNMNSYTPKIVSPCFKFRCDFSSDGNTQIDGPTTSNVSIKWKNNNKGKNSSYNTNSPVTDGSGNIYIANPNIVKSYDDQGNVLSSGGVLYKYNVKGNLIWSFGNVDGNINTTPCIGKNYIYFGCDDGYLYALNFDSRIQWKYFVGVSTISSSPTFDSYNNNVYIGSSTGLVAVDNKGKLVWSYKINGNVITCPAINSDYSTVYFTSTNGYLYAVNTSDGSLKWKYQANDGIQSSPAIAPNGTIYFGCNDGFLYAVNPPNSDSQTGNLIWKFNNGINAGQIKSSPAVDINGNIYYTTTEGSGLGSQGALYIVNPNGTTKNRYNIDNPTVSSVLLDGNNNIFFGAGVYLYGISKDAVLLWSLELGGEVNSSPVLDNKGNLVVGCNDGFLYSIIGE